MDRKQLTALLLALVLLFSLAACHKKPAADAEEVETPAPSETASPAPQENDMVFTRGTKLSLAADKDLEITRDFGDIQPKTPPQDGKWTVFVYMCGSNLESEHGYASTDLQEMAAATKQTADLRFFVLAGGSSQWFNDFCADGQLTFLLIENGTVQALGNREGNMGDPSLLYAFLKTGLEQYDAQHIVLDLWDHGGGSLGGVCVDECYDGDRIHLVELDMALSAVYQETRRQFDLIGFDACLMATVETANLLVPYGNYMIASEESEPGTGWNYTSFGDAVAAGASDGKALGTELVKGYFNALAGWDAECTLSVVELAQVDRLLKALNAFSIDLYDDIQQRGGLDRVLRESHYISNFGEGKYNLVDLGELVTVNAGCSDDAQRVKALLDEAVVYMQNGAAYRDAGGLSTYFPVASPSGYELEVLKNICVTPYYMAVVDMCVYGKETMGALEGYDPSQWLEEDGAYWSDTELDPSHYTYWVNEVDVYAVNRDYDKIAVKFAVEPHVEALRSSVGQKSVERKAITFTAAEGYGNKVGQIYDNYYNEIIDPHTKRPIYLSYGKQDTYDMGLLLQLMLDWWSMLYNGDDLSQMELPDLDALTGNTDFIRNMVLYLPNGQILAQYPYQYTREEDKQENATLAERFAPRERFCPILYNGQSAILKCGAYLGDQGDAMTWGAFVLLDPEDGMSSRALTPQKGDVITPIYASYDPATMAFLGTYQGEPYTWAGDESDCVLEGPGLHGDSYKCSVTIADIYGNTADTPVVSVRFDIDWINDPNRLWEYEILDDQFVPAAAPAPSPLPSPEPPAEEPVVEEPTVEYCSVDLYVDCIQNPVMNQYDVDVLVDDQFIGTVGHGKQKTYPLKMTPGTYTLEFRVNGKDWWGEPIYRLSESDSYHKETITVSGDMSLSYQAKLVFGDGIKITKTG